MSTNLERKVVIAMWAILLTYIGWSSVMMWTNSLKITRIEERTVSMTSRLDKVETFNETLTTVREGCLSRYRELLSEIQMLMSNTKAESEWRRHIETRLDDLRGRVDRLEK